MGYEDGGYAGTLDAIEKDNTSEPDNAVNGRSDFGSTPSELSATEGQNQPTESNGNYGSSSETPETEGASRLPQSTTDDSQDSSAFIGDSSASFDDPEEDGQDPWYERAMDIIANIPDAVEGYLARRRELFYPGDELISIAQEAYSLHPEYCNLSTEHVANAYENHDLDNKNANQQIVQMQIGWEEIDAKTAQIRANNGELVVAGLAEPGGHGHTAVVTPGNGHTASDGGFYPNVTCGGPPEQRSDGSRTVADVWSRSDPKNVRYYTPR